MTARQMPNRIGPSALSLCARIELCVWEYRIVAGVRRGRNPIAISKAYTSRPDPDSHHSRGEPETAGSMNALLSPEKRSFPGTRNGPGISQRLLQSIGAARRL